LDCRDVLLGARSGPTDNDPASICNDHNSFGASNSKRVPRSELAEHQALVGSWIEDPSPVLTSGHTFGLFLYARSVLKCLDLAESHPFTKPVTLRHRVRLDHAADRDGHIERNSRGLLLLGWVILFHLLAYAPFNLQRRLPEGIWVALLSLAAIGLQGWLGDNVKIERWVGRFLLSFGLLSSLLLIAAGMDVAIRPKEPAFRKFEEVEAFSWLNEEAEPNSVVLAAFHTGNALPAWAPVRVVIGHGPESVDLEELEPQVDAFYDEKMTDAERLQFIRSHDVQYVWYGPRENALGSWNPARSDFLTLAYSYADYKIYSVQSSHE